MEGVRRSSASPWNRTASSPHFGASSALVEQAAFDVDEAQPDEALDGVEFGPPHVFDFLSHMVQVEFVGQIPPSGEVA